MSHEVAPQPWLNPPLGFKIDSFLDSVEWSSSADHTRIYPLVVLFRSGAQWGRALAAWCLCCFLLCQENNFRSSLSTTQFNCVRLLLEWWTARCQDRRLTVAAINFMLANVETAAPDPKAEANAGILESSYHSRQFQLFKTEFCAPLVKPASSSIYPSDLPKRRTDAAVAASCQRLGTWCYNNAHQIPNAQLEGGHDDAHDDEPADLGLTVESGNEARSGPLADALRWPQRLADDPSFQSRHRPLGASLEACSWLEPSEKTAFAPHFLWDVSKRKTVEVSSLDHEPEYTAVSHTWGRWRLTDQPYVQVDGVDWLVPQNCRFDVKKLPELLAAVPGGAPFVWFDLVCIPQIPREDTTSEFALLKRQEVSRQDSIFSRAKNALVWFSDIPTLGTLQFVVYWMALYLVERPRPRSPDINAVFASASAAAQGLPSAATTYLMRFDQAATRGWVENGWFSSLWTLQESYLRPDMWICDAEFRVLIGEGSTPMGLDSLLALAKGCSGRVNGEGKPIVERQPRPPEIMAGLEVVVCLGQIGMTGLNNLSALSVLRLGSQRTCKDNSRAPAIMSAIGAKEWYAQDNGPSEQGTSRLVLGQYPWEFVCEIRRKFKAIFFATRTLNNRNPNTSLPSDLVPVGSMLPFTSEPAGTLKADTLFEHTLGYVPQHPSVEGWEVRDDGAVSLPEVGIVASSTDEESGSKDIEVSLTALNPNMLTSDESALGIGMGITSVWLRQWIRERSYVCHAVWLFHEDLDVLCSRRNVFGLLLRQIQGQSYVKVGDFACWNGAAEVLQSPPSTEVDWIVL